MSSGGVVVDAEEACGSVVGESDYAYCCYCEVGVADYVVDAVAYSYAAEAAAGGCGSGWASSVYAVYCSELWSVECGAAA